MSDFPENFDSVTQPLLPENLGEAGAQAVKLLHEKGYEVHSGLTAEFAEQILLMSRETSIHEYCPKDQSERFANHSATKNWLSKKRAMFLLLKKVNNGVQLAGYGWSGAGHSSEVPGGATTFALRIGEAHQGQGLAAPFSQAIIAATAAQYGAKDFWLETWASNSGAVHVYHKVGFVNVAEQPGERQQSNGEKVSDTRIYMSLPNSLL